MLKIENQAREIDSRAELYKKQLLEEHELKICRLEEKMDKFVKDTTNNKAFALECEFEIKKNDATKESEQKIRKMRELFENNHAQWEDEIFNKMFKFK